MKALLNALSLSTFLLFCIWSQAAVAQNQTNDPLVDQQQYLFDVHSVDQAWTTTTGSSGTRIGLYSMLGFIQNHEDLGSSRLLTPQGSLQEPDLDFASEMAGIAGADTDNSTGMAGIDWAARLQSYSVLREVEFGDDEDNIITFNRPGGPTEEFYLDLNQFSSLVNQGRTSGIDVHLFSFGVPSGKEVDFPLPNLPDSELSTVPKPKTTSQYLADSFLNILRGRVDTILNTICGGPGNVFGDCTSPPDPLENLRVAVGNAVALDGGVVVAPAGDLETTGQQTINYLPAMFDKFAVAVGGINYQGGQGTDLIKWSRSKEAPYVDVAAFAEDMVGLSGTGTDQYNTEFGGTAAAAAIGGGVAALLKAENASLSGEDIEEILERTAVDVGAAGRDDATGFGAINADAALDLVRTNDVQRESVTVSSVLSDQSTGDFYYLQGSGYQTYNPYSTTYPLIQGELHTFTARINFTESFSSAPDVWLRWSQSDGVDTDFRPISGNNPPFSADAEAVYDPFDKALQVVSVDATGFTVEGKYWFATFYNTWGQEHPTNAYIPTSPSSFTIAYTAVGTEGSLPLNASISGPSSLSKGQQGTWTANASGGQSPYSYRWDYKLLCGGPLAAQGSNEVQQFDVPCDQWHYGGSGSSFNRSTSLDVTLRLKLTVTDAASTSEIAYKNVTIGSGGGGPFAAAHKHADGQTVDGQALAGVPEVYALEGNYPNPFNPSTEIRFALPEASAVSLVVYDVMGREVATLVERQMSAGEHNATWDASSLPSGTYLYRLTAGDFTQTKSMVLMK